MQRVVTTKRDAYENKYSNLYVRILRIKYSPTILDYIRIVQGGLKYRILAHTHTHTMTRLIALQLQREY